MLIKKYKKTGISLIDSFYKGQTLLVVVLIMVISLTVGLSVVSRSITDIRTASDDENSQRAFTAAEAGIEQALQDGESLISGSFSGNNAVYETTVETLGDSGEFLLNNGSSILKDQPADIWLSTYSEDDNLNYSNPWSGNLTISWGSDDDLCDPEELINTEAALEIVLIRGSKASPQSSHFLFDPCDSRRTGVSGNNFSSPTVGSFSVAGDTFSNQVTIPINSGLLARLIPLYASAKIGISGNSTLPPQGVVITSIGRSGSSERKVVSFRSNPGLPVELFPYILFVPK